MCVGCVECPIALQVISLRVDGSRLRAGGRGCRVPNVTSGYRVPDVGFRMSTSGCRVPNIRSRNSSLGFQPFFTHESCSQTLNHNQVETAIKEMMKLRIDRSNSITLSYFPSDLPPCIDYPERDCSRMFEKRVFLLSTDWSKSTLSSR